MPFVVSRIRSIKYIGTNGDELQEITSGDPYWTFASDNGSEVRWDGADGDNKVAKVGDYVLVTGAGRLSACLSEQDYQERYYEIIQ